MGYSVLVAEDEPNIVLSLQFIMKKAGLQVRIAEDGDQAILEIEKDRPNAILLDIMLPKRDGFSVCEVIKSNPEWSAIKVIMLTAKGREEDKQRALGLGADDYITKPFSTRELVDRVIELIQEGESANDPGTAPK
ncbi:MAG: response regulator [Rhodospirillales bacterium]|jgi:DNA-binding response OmpR family regulator|nr:response regulator [Rhodospirillales bacterium]